MQARLPFQLGFGPFAGGDALSHGEVVPNERLSSPIANQHHRAGDIPWIFFKRLISDSDSVDVFRNVLPDIHG